MFPLNLLGRRARLAAALVPVAVLIGFGGWRWASNWHPAPSAFPIQGIDVSEADGAIDWWGVRRSGAQFAYAVATTGTNRRDPSFPANWRGMGDAGLKRGAMHVYSLCQPAIDQAGNFVSTVARTDDQLAPAVLIDFQPDCAARPERTAVVAEIGRLVEAIETHTGRPAVLKVSSAFETHYRLSEATSQPLWSARPFFQPAYSARPWTIWQASSFRRIEGADNLVHWDVMVR